MSGIQSNYETIVFVDTPQACRLLEGRFLTSGSRSRCDVERQRELAPASTLRDLDRVPAPVWMVEVDSPKNLQVRPTRTISTSFVDSGPADTGQIRWRVPAERSRPSRSRALGEQDGEKPDHGDINYQFVKG